ncbi:MAG TPA: CHAT domain-containing protein, partial [Pyrinomonadaceae bacterium]|nr:CHAT domain-containing protein [Pyrinomonadaceae bacterium]
AESLAARSVTRSLEAPEQRRARIADADAKFKQVNAELSRMILAPAAAEFGKKRLVVVLDGALNYVPVAALSLAANRPIIIDHEIVSLQSASTFAVQRQNLSNREPAPKAVAVIADPVFSTTDARLKSGAAQATTSDAGSTRIIEHTSGVSTGQLSIPRLPYTRWEADQILAVAPRQSSLKASDFGASRSMATSDELSKYRYVHFATHGYLDKQRAGLSAIVLSMVDEQGKPQDGFLRTHDIYNLKLPAELVVLSACETGLGKDIQGEGLEGLTRGFMYAGARRVIVSLWNVNDKATAALMQRLYAGMLRSNKTPAAALRAAQIEMLRMRPWQSPYYWAAFVMQGEWR